MDQTLLSLPILPILAASVANFFLGGIWYGVLMSAQYPAALGISAQKPAPVAPGPLFYLGPFATDLVRTAAAAVLVRALGVMELREAVSLGVFLGLGFYVPMTLNIAINPLFPRPFFYTLLNAPYFVASGVVSCVVLVALL